MYWKSWIVRITLILLIGWGGASLVSAQRPQPVRSSHFVLLSGEIIAVDAEGFTLRTPDQNLIVIVTDETNYRAMNRQVMSLAELPVGSVVMVFGARDEDGTLVAKWVRTVDRALKHNLLQNVQQSERGTGLTGQSKLTSKREITTSSSGGRTMIFRGEVTAIDLQAGTLTVDTGQDWQLIHAPIGNLAVNAGRGQWIFYITPRTRYQSSAADTFTLTDIEVGDRVVVSGNVDEAEGHTGIAQLVMMTSRS
jgi:hypothetical protein